MLPLEPVTFDEFDIFYDCLFSGINGSTDSTLEEVIRKMAESLKKGEKSKTSCE